MGGGERKRKGDGRLGRRISSVYIGPVALQLRSLRRGGGGERNVPSFLRETDDSESDFIADLRDAIRPKHARSYTLRLRILHNTCIPEEKKEGGTFFMSASFRGRRGMSFCAPPPPAPFCPTLYCNPYVLR